MNDRLLVVGERGKLLASRSLSIKVICMLLFLGEIKQKTTTFCFWRTHVLTMRSSLLFQKNSMMKQTDRTSNQFSVKINWIKNRQQAPCCPFLAWFYSLKKSKNGCTHLTCAFELDWHSFSSLKRIAKCLLPSVINLKFHGRTVIEFSSWHGNVLPCIWRSIAINWILQYYQEFC